jgi:hypothetical protein
MEADAARAEAESWQQAERDIRRQHEEGCRNVGRVGSVAGIGGPARAACDAPRVIYDANERRRERKR